MTVGKKRRGSVAAAYGSPRSSGAAGKRETARQDRGLLQLVICSAIFVLFVAVKLLLPGKMDTLNQKLSAAMERNMDVKAVFSSVGSLFTEGSSVSRAADEVYQAVFGPEEEPRALLTAAAYPMADSTALDELRRWGSVVKTPPEEEEIPDEAASEGETAYVRYSGRNLPENVSMEQVILGMEYRSPIEGRITSGFGYREHPIEGEEHFHYGLDIGAETGAPILCFAAGKVTTTGESNSYGKYCVVTHDNGCSTLYAHCSKLLTSTGKKVSAGEEIARVGETGMATGPHLHFELQKDGVYLNPIYYVSQP